MDFGLNGLMPQIIQKALDTFNSVNMVVYLVGGIVLAFLLMRVLIKLGLQIKGR